MAIIHMIAICYFIFSIIFPFACPDSEYSIACCASSKGKMRSITGFICPCSMYCVIDVYKRQEGTGIMMEKYHVIVMNAPPQKVFCLRKTISVSETHELFQELLKEMKDRGFTRTGVTQQMYMGDEFSYDAMDVEAQVEVAQDGDGVKTLPAGTFAAVTHVGPYETVRYAYEAIQNWFENQNEYEACGPAIERFLKDEEMALSLSLIHI